MTITNSANKSSTAKTQRRNFPIDRSPPHPSLPHNHAPHAQSLHKYVPVLKWMFVIYCNHRVFAHMLVGKGLVCGVCELVVRVAPMCTVASRAPQSFAALSPESPRRKNRHSRPHQPREIMRPTRAQWFRYERKNRKGSEKIWTSTNS